MSNDLIIHEWICYSHPHRIVKRLNGDLETQTNRGRGWYCYDWEDEEQRNMDNATLLTEIEKLKVDNERLRKFLTELENKLMYLPLKVEIRELLKGGE